MYQNIYFKFQKIKKQKNQKKNKNTKKAKETKEENSISGKSIKRKIAAFQVKIFLVTRISGDSIFFLPYAYVLIITGGIEIIWVGQSRLISEEKFVNDP